MVNIPTSNVTLADQKNEVIVFLLSLKQMQSLYQRDFYFLLWVEKILSAIAQHTWNQRESLEPHSTPAPAREGSLQSTQHCTKHTPAPGLPSKLSKRSLAKMLGVSWSWRLFRSKWSDTTKLCHFAIQDGTVALPGPTRPAFHRQPHLPPDTPDHIFL